MTEEKPKSKKVLIVVNEDSDGVAKAEFDYFFDVDGHNYERVIGREEALRGIGSEKVDGVYIDNTRLDWGSERRPDLANYRAFGGQPSAVESNCHFDDLTAAMFEVVMVAREKGLPVLVDGFNSEGNREADALRKLGAVPVNSLKDDYRTIYGVLKRELEKGEKK